MRADFKWAPTLVLAICLTQTVPASAQTNESRIHYKINARLVPDSGYALVQSRITVPIAAIPASGELMLRARRSVVRSGGRPLSEALRITDENGRVLPGRPGVDSFAVVVHAAPAAQRATRLTLQVEHRQPLEGSDITQLGYYLFAARDASDALYADVEGMPDSIARFRDFDVTVSHPAGWSILTSGTEQSRVENADTVRAHYLARHIEGFAVALGKNFKLKTVERAGVRVIAFSPPDLEEKLEFVAEQTAEAIAWYRQAYGFFPVAQIGIVPGVQRSSGGFPMSNLFMIHRGDLSAEFIRWITAHELGHYYWGLYTLDPQERLGWLVLANGIWADHLYLAQRTNTTLERAWRAGVQGNSFLDLAIAQAGNYEQRLGLYGPAEDSLDFDYNSYVRHGKAAVGIYLLARRIGANAFLTLQRQILNDYAYRVLPESAFVARLEHAGITDARPFIDAWKRGDARLGYSIESVRPDSAANAYHVTLWRTGTIAMPVEVELRSQSGRAVRHTFAGVLEIDTAGMQLDAPLAEARLDAAGTLPMWESSHPDIRRLYIRALDEAGQREAFLDAALPFLREHPDSELRALVLTRLFNLARFDRVVALVDAEPDALACDTRATCRATILASLALARRGMPERAVKVLEDIQPRVADFAAEQRWQQARAEISRLTTRPPRKIQ